MNYIYLEILGEMHLIGAFDFEEDEWENISDALWCELKYISLVKN